MFVGRVRLMPMPLRPNLGQSAADLTAITSSSWAPAVLIGGVGLLVWAFFLRGRRHSGGSTYSTRARKVGSLARAAAALD